MIKATLVTVLGMLLAALTGIALLTLLNGCAGPQPVPTPTASCATACANGSKLGCEWAEPTTIDGALCEDVCITSSKRVPWKVDCLTTTMSCDRLACP